MTDIRNNLTIRDAFSTSAVHNDFIGFDSLFDRVLNSFESQNLNTYPPYDIYTTTVKVKDEGKRFSNIRNETHTFLEFAVAGFTKDSLQVELSQDNILTIKNKQFDGIATETSDGKKYLHKGIATRNFTIQKSISDDLILVGCRLENGLLTIEFKPKDKTEYKTQIIDIK